MSMPAILISQINKTFGASHRKNQALFDLSLSIQPGEVFGFIGPNGAGKSTTIKLLMNFIRPDTGTISLFGQDVVSDEFRQNLGYLSEVPCFYERLTAKETLQLAGRLSGTAKQTLIKRIPELLDSVNLTRAINQRVGTFSKGMKQRLGFAAALIHDPEILIFDEPMSGLDPLGRHQIKTLIIALREQGKTVFFSSHILSDIEDLCDRIGVIHKGHLLYSGELTGFITKLALEETFVEVISDWERSNAQ